MSSKRAAVCVVVLSVSLLAAACQTGVKAGGRCRTTDFGESGAFVLKCVKGRWQRVATKAQVSQVVLAILKARTIAAPTIPTVASRPLTGAVAVPPVTRGKKCTLQMSGAGTSNNGELDVANPTGYVQVTPPKLPNEVSPGQRRAFWEYDGPHNYRQTPGTGERDYVEHRNSVSAFLDDRGCGPTMVVGGSNGGAFAAKLYCRGEDFGGRVWGYFFKDPVWDHGVLGCTPSSNISHKLAVHSVWLKRLAEGTAPGYRCDQISEVNVRDQFPGENGDWYCEDNLTLSEAAWEGATGVSSVLAGTAHIGSYDLEPDLADWTIQGVWWCDWMRDNGQPTGSNCDWTWNHKWHSM